MVQTHIPESMADAIKSLTGIGTLLTAKQWERAAIVYAFTGDAKPGPKVDRLNTKAISIAEFARLGIVGLKSENTVAEYRKAWQSAIDDGHAVPVKPGDTVDVPDLAWPPTGTGGDHVSGAFARIRRDLRADPVGTMEKLVADSPETIVDIARGVRQLPSVQRLVDAQRQPIVRESSPRPARDYDYSAELRKAVSYAMRVLGALRDEEWTPDPMEQTLLAFLAQAFAEAAGRESQTNVISEIEAFLAVQR